MNEQPDFCDACQSDAHVNTIDSRGTRNGRLRRYYCSKCHTRWSTNERKSSYTDIGKLSARRALAVKVGQLSSLVKEMERAASNIQ